MPKLYMFLIGCTPHGRHTEQHDVFFGIGESIKKLLPDVKAFWPGANGLHFDAWREVTSVDGYQVEVIEDEVDNISAGLFFINLGGYKKNEFEEFHYKMIVAATDKGEAVRIAKQTAFYKHTGFKEAESHIDDKYGIDVDDIFNIEDILPLSMKQKYKLRLTPKSNLPEDKIHLGYFRIENVDKWSADSDD